MRLPLAALVAALALVVPAAAVASDVTSDGTTITWTAAAGETNAVIVSPLDAGNVQVTDNAVTAGAGCTQVNATTATCPVATGAVVMAAGDMDDTLTCGGLTIPCAMNGEGGDDTLIGGAGAQTLAGGEGIDTASYAAETDNLSLSLDGAANDDDGDNIEVENVVGGTGNDTLVGDAAGNGLDGGGGDDTLDGGAGPDVLAGGAGVDTATYAAVSADLEVSLDGEPNDGPDGDDVGADVENLVGGAGGDVLIGNAGDNSLDGGGGDDAIAGDGGADALQGGEGTDLLEGDEGADALGGGPGDDLLGGGGGDDALAGGDGDDQLDGGDGADSLVGDAGEDVLVGGFGPDVMSGGVGDFDVVVYLERQAPVDVVIGGGPVSGNADDGLMGARDTVDVERVVGGDGGDRLSGVGGNHGFDSGPGDDTIEARDGDVDSAFCGAGSDVAIVDPIDFVDETECERVDRGDPPPSPPPSPPGGPPPPSPPAPLPSAPQPTPPGGSRTIAARPVRGQTLRSFLARGLRVRITCPTACRAKLRILVSRRIARRRELETAIVARGSARLTGPGRVTAVVKASRRTRRRLRTIRRLPVTVEARVTPTGRQTRLHRFELALRRG